MTLSIGSRISRKFAFIAFLALAFTVLLLMIYGVIEERRQRGEAVATEIGKAWGSKQRVIGPLLVIPYVARAQTGDEKPVKKWVIVLPDALRMDAQVLPERRQRGLFEAVVYQASLAIVGSLPVPKQAMFDEVQGASGNEVLWHEAFLSLALSDIHSLKTAPTATVAAVPLEFLPGSRLMTFLPQGMHAKMPPLLAGQALPFALKFALNGSQALEMIPLGKETALKMTSPWPSPSFIGSYLPDKRSVESAGFEAEWHIPSLSRGYPQVFASDDSLAVLQGELAASSFGVAFYQPAGAYQQNERAVKYGFLIILLTFLAFFLVEVKTGREFHLIQYGFVGLSLALFFLLLLAFSEALGFASAYTFAAAAVIVQVTLYAMSVLKSLGQALKVASCLAGLYGHIYFILQLEDYALLVGALSLFVLLGLIMYATRAFDWAATGEWQSSRER